MKLAFASNINRFEWPHPTPNASPNGHNWFNWFDVEIKRKMEINKHSIGLERWDANEPIDTVYILIAFLFDTRQFALFSEKLRKGLQFDSKCLVIFYEKLTKSHQN